MSEKLPNMLETTIQKIREMVDANTVVGEPVTTPDGVTILPVSKISVGLGGGGSDFAMSKAPAGQMAFLVVKDGNVRIMTIAEPANATADRIVEMVPDTLDKISAFLDSRKKPE